MSVFRPAETEYVRGEPPARLATVGRDGRPQVKPPTRIVSWGIDCSPYAVSARDVAPRTTAKAG